MQKRFAQVTAMALLIAVMAGPAYAGNDKEKENRGNAFGRIFGQIKKELNLELKKERKEAREEQKHDDDDEDEDENARRLCLKAAEEAHKAALKAASAERDASLNVARTAYHKALADAQKARRDATMSALATFKASAMTSSDQAIFIAAYVKAHADWQTAKNAAQTTWDAAKAPAEAKWRAAKVKADAEFKVAKEKCKAATTTPPPTTTDTTAPSTPSISLSAATVSSVLVSWTAPGDDGSTGTAASYDLRYSTSPIVTAADFTAAAQASGEPTPAVAGTAQSMTVTGLTANTVYHFALQAKDEANNVSATSNVPSLSTLAVVVDVTAPAAIANLSLSAPTSSAMIVAWTAPGDDGSTGTAASYDLRYSTSPIVTAADFTAATTVTGEPAPSVGGSSQSMAVTGLTASTTYHFAMKSQDEVPNVSAMSNVPTLATIAP